MMTKRPILLLMHLLMIMFVGIEPGSVSAKSDSPVADKKAISDKEITFAIEARFVVDPWVPENTVDVETHDGVVTLSGKVNTLLAKDRAVRIVRTVRGVEAILETIEVIPEPEVDDEVLRTRVEEALVRDPATESFDVTLSSQDGVVVLNGTVDSWQEKQLSEQVAKSVKGVVEVDNRLKVRPAAERTDSEIEAEVRKQLQSDVWVDGKLIGVMVNKGKVTLTGSVGSLAEKYSAFTDAWVSGVIDVNVDPLEIDWDARDTMRRNPAELFRTSEQVQEALHLAWKYDPRVDASEIEVQVTNGIVTLTGVVNDLRAKRAAEEDAENTIGVFRVRNFLKVRRAQTFSDETFKEWVQKALQQNALLDPYELKVTVQEGTVFLDGYVETVFEVAQAVQTAEDVKGVRKVVSRLKFETPSTGMTGKSDKEIWYDIMQSIWWDPRLYQEDIHAEVKGGEVTLTGTVFSIQSLHKLSQIAREAGAVNVKNRVKVKYAPDYLSAKIIPFLTSPHERARVVIC